MEYLPHGDLRKHLVRPLPEDEARTIGRQVLEGLKCMHENGFVHRDLKPQNILVVSPGPEWFVQISDFGISRRLEESGTVTMGHGTMGFMAPETLGYVRRGSSPYAADMWSLGALLFFALTNTIFLKDLDRLKDFVGGNLSAAGAETQVLRRLAVSEECSGFVFRLLRPSPDERPSSQEASEDTWVAVPGAIQGQDTPSDVEEGNAGDETPESVGAAAPFPEATATWASTGIASQPHGEPASPPKSGLEAIEEPVDIEEPKSEGAPSISGLLASFSTDGRIKFWDPATGRCQRTVKCVDAFWEGYATAFSPDVQTLAVSLRKPEFSQVRRLTRGILGRNHEVRLFDVATGQCRRVLKGHRATVRSIVFSADSSLLGSGSLDEMIKIWDAATGQCLRTFKGDGERALVARVVLSADFGVVASEDNNEITIRDQATGQRKTIHRLGTKRVYALALSPDSRLLAASLSLGTVSIWELSSNMQVANADIGYSITAMFFSPDSASLAIAARDGTLHIWELATKHVTRTSKFHSGPVSSVAFLPNSSFMAAGSADRTMSVWDLETGRLLHMFKDVLNGHNGHVLSVAFSAKKG
jgi:hypothetical protein